MVKSNIDVLIVEDNILFKESLSKFIDQTDGMSCVYSYSDCEDAISAISENNLLPDVILLDIGLPGISGIDGIKHFRDLLPDAKIIMLTIQDDDESIFNSICMGASGYLLKDTSTDNILLSIKEVLDGGAPMNPGVAQKVLSMFRKFVPEQKDYQLSERETEILNFLTKGLSKKQIAEKLFISHHTVDSHIRNIYAKLEVHSSCEAVAKAFAEKLL